MFYLLSNIEYYCSWCSLISSSLSFSSSPSSLWLPHPGHWTSFQPSIHPFSTVSVHLVQGGAGYAIVFSLATSSRSSLEVPRPDEICNTSSMVCQCFLPVGHAWNTSTGRRPGDILIRNPNHLSPQTQRSSDSTSSSLQVSNLPTRSPRVSQPAKETQFGRLYPQSFSCPKLMAIGEGWNISPLWRRNQRDCVQQFL